MLGAGGGGYASLMAEVVGVELVSPGGEPLRLEWDAGALDALRAPLDEAKATWRLSGELDWDAVEALRVVSGRFEDGRTLAVGGLRPAGSEGHGGEVLAGLLDSSERLESGAVLLSTEYGPDGLPRRVGLELRTGADGVPLRVAADVERAETAVEGGVRHVRAALKLRLDGTGGVGVYEILTQR